VGNFGIFSHQSLATKPAKPTKKETRVFQRRNQTQQQYACALAAILYGKTLGDQLH